jgi:hypothetical protein
MADNLDMFWSELPSVMREFPDILAQIEDDEGEIFIASIECRRQGQGIGTAFMTRLSELADSLGLDLTADPAESGGDRLVRWYEGLGFSFENSYRMIRFASDSLSPRF